MTHNCTELHSCLACGSNNLKLTLDLGTQPPANSYKDTKDEIQEEFPLAINRCTDCYHVQLTHVVDPDILYKNYLYVSGTSQTMKNHFEWFAKWSLEYFRYHRGNSTAYNDSGEIAVLDVGCNDGSQLDAYAKHRKVLTHGVDPAANLHHLSNKLHNVTLGYFDDDFMEAHLNKPEFDIIVAQNVFAHNPDPLGFLQRARAIMDDDSLLFVQTSQADMILNNEFDTIYHEHISFYNINSMDKLAKRAGMYLIDVQKCPLHGNSYIFILSQDEYRARPAHIANLIAMEEKAGLMSEKTYEEYARKCHKVMKEFRELVDSYVRNEVGWTAVGYGAAAKAMTLLNASKARIDYIVDDNPLKQGKFTPGSSIPIVDAHELAGLNQEALLIPLAWNFFDEIKEKIATQKPFNRYDTFVRYFPEVRTEVRKP